jgi:hypothetical protein
MTAHLPFVVDENFDVDIVAWLIMGLGRMSLGGGCFTFTTM